MSQRCPWCGGDAPVALVYDPLVAASDVLIMRALELIGKRLVTRHRRGAWESKRLPWYHAHLFWQADADSVNSALSDAWVSIPAVLSEHGCCGITEEELTTILDRYVRDLVLRQVGHDVKELRYRLSAYLGVPT